MNNICICIRPKIIIRCNTAPVTAPVLAPAPVPAVSLISQLLLDRIKPNFQDNPRAMREWDWIQKNLHPLSPNSILDKKRGGTSNQAKIQPTRIVLKLSV